MRWLHRASAGQPLRGYLTGSIDAVLRLPGPAFAVVDYKTNWLGPSAGRTGTADRLRTTGPPRWPRR